MHPDPKQGEREYFARIGPDGIAHSNGKPFSDENCPIYLSNMAALFQLLEGSPKRVVEFGCGVGWLSLYLARRGHSVTGVDISPEAIAAARSQRDEQRLPNADFVVADYEEFSPGENFDCALFHDSLHHAEDERAAVRCAYRSLRPGGMMLAFEPGRGHSTTAASKHAVLEYGVHEKDMPAEYIEKLGREAGFVRSVLMPRPYEITSRLYNRSYLTASDQAYISWKSIRSRWHVFRLLINRRRKSPIVAMWK